MRVAPGRRGVTASRASPKGAVIRARGSQSGSTIAIATSERKQHGYRFPVLLPLPDVARSPRLPPDSLFSFDRRWSIFLRPLSCFCFATRTPNSGGQNPSTCLGPIRCDRRLHAERDCAASSSSRIIVQLGRDDTHRPLAILRTLRSGA